MTTSFLNQGEVSAYFADLAQRLEKLDPKPEIICVLARSGTSLLPYLIGHSVVDEATAIAIDVETGSDGQRKVIIDEGDAELVRGKRVLLMDGAVHSGSTLAMCVQHLLDCGAADVCSYALAIKRGASFIPSLFGIMLNDTDRLYYLLSPLPNNRLQTGSRPPFCGNLRKLEAADLTRPALVSGVGSMDRITWADRFYDSQVSDSRSTYLLQAGQTVVGFLTINQSRRNGFSIDEIVVDPEHQGFGYGGILLRFADTLARHSSHSAIHLMAIENKVPLYENLGYRALRDKPALHLPNSVGSEEKYTPMERPILYHVRTDMDQE